MFRPKRPPKTRPRSPRKSPRAARSPKKRRRKKRLPPKRLRPKTPAKKRPKVKTCLPPPLQGRGRRSEEHTSELQSLMRISYAVFCLKKKTHNHETNSNATTKIYDIQ